MARITTDELLGYRFDVKVTDEQVIADDGMPVFNGTGEPKLAKAWRFVYSRQQPDGTSHVVISQPFGDEERKKLVEFLTGGVVPVSAIDLPPGIEL